MKNVLIGGWEIFGYIPALTAERPELHTPAMQYGRAVEPFINVLLNPFIGKKKIRTTLTDMQDIAQRASDEFWKSSEQWARYPRPMVVLRFSRENSSIVEWGIREFPKEV